MSPPQPLKGSRRFEQKPKRVIKADDFSDQCGVEHDARLLLELNEILDCIHNGWEITDRYYPRDVDKHGDRLLDELGVKHLHLGGRGSDIIVYLAEFDVWVELIEINTHVHLESEPRGKELKGRFRSAAVVGAAAAGAVVAMATAKAAKLKGKKKGRVTHKNSK